MELIRIGYEVRVRALIKILVVFLVTYACSATAGDLPGTLTLTTAERQWLSSHPVITLAPDPDFKPIEFFDKNGAYQGAAADIIHLLEKKLGITITIARLKNWDDAMARFKNHEVDILGAMVKTPNREKFALFTDTLVTVPGAIFSRNRSLNALTLNDLKGKKVAVVSNYTAHDVLAGSYPGIALDVVPDVSTGLAKASLGMVDAYVENMANATFYLQEAGITNLQMVGKTDFEYRWAIGIRKDWPELQAILNKGLAAVSEEERQRSIRHWVHVEGMRWQPSKAFVIGMVAAALGSLLLLAMYWNYSLRKVVRNRTAALQDELDERLRAEAALTLLSEKLEEKVRERTAELEVQAEERNKSEQRFRLLIDNSNDVIFLLDSMGFFQFVSPAWEKHFGYPVSDVLGQDFAPFVHPDDVKPCAEYMMKVMSSGEAATSPRYRVRHRNGSWRSFIANGSRFVDVTGTRLFLGVGRDISDQVRAEEDRIQLEKQMLHAQKLESLGVLAGGIAHDFNNILMVIMGNADLALMRINKESPAVDNLHKIELAAARAADLAKQMLAYSGKGKFMIEHLDLNHLLEDMLHMLEVSISKKAVLRFNLHQPLPQVEADATQMRQIIMNLIINASEAIGDKSGIIAVTTGCMDCDRSYLKDVWLDENLTDGLYVYLEIADTGCGMDKETMSKLFDPFFTTKFTGRGLGMAAVLGIVRGHKGAIKVYSEAGKGTSFKVLLPASDRPAELFNGESHKDDWKGCGTVLLVDDEETVRGIGVEMLKELGFAAVTANDGREALEIFRSNPEITFVIMDLTMPHMDGEQCFRELRLLNPNVKVIMSSGYNEQEVTQRFVGKGLAGFVQKPYKLSVLKEAIRDMV